MVVQTSFEDYKDIDGIISSIQTALKEFGIMMCQDPSDEGTDGYSFILVDGIDEDDIYQSLKQDVMVELGYDEDDMEDGSMEDEVNRITDERLEIVLKEFKEQ